MSVVGMLDKLPAVVRHRSPSVLKALVPAYTCGGTLITSGIVRARQEVPPVV
jgi:hypothetical protein